MTDEWWPENYDRPAFQVQRQVYGAVEGGDYVRGSTQLKGTLSGAATALPSGPVEGDMWLVGSPVPTAIPTYTPPGTPPPPSRPAAVGDVIRRQGAAWVNIGPIAQSVSTALRYPRTDTGASSIAGTALMHVAPINYSTVQIEWGWPAAPNDDWLEVALVRSAFGRPSTVNDGATVYRRVHADFVVNSVVQDPPILLDEQLPAGRWYHYSLFFKVGPVEWVRGMVSSCLLPRNLQHAQHLWENVPPYYRWVDGQQSYREGRLRQFLNVFGFELDNEREFIESWQHVYDSDWSPIRLLRKLGPNFGVPYEAGLGDIRYRSLMADIGNLYKTRGTRPGLEHLVANMSKYQCTATAGSSLMLTPDDSDFFRGSGNWAGMHPQTNMGQTFLAPDKVFLDKAPVGEVIPPKGRGALKVWTLAADATTNLMITTGDGIRYPNNNADPTTMKEILPGSYGIPAYPRRSYGMSFAIRVSTSPLNVEACLMYFGKGGTPFDLLATFKSPTVGISDTAWHDYTIKGTAPTGTAFVVPGIICSSRPAAGGSVSPSIYVAGVMVYAAGDEGEVLAVPPDRYLTMGDPGELIGAASPAQPAFKPFLIGAPRPS